MSVHLVVHAFPHGATTDELMHGETIKGFPFAMGMEPPVNSYLPMRSGKSFTAGKDMSRMQIP